MAIEWRNLIPIDREFEYLFRDGIMNIEVTIGSNLVKLILKKKIDDTDILIDAYLNDAPLFYNLLPVMNEGFIHTRVICNAFDGDFVFIPNTEHLENCPIDMDNIKKNFCLYYGFTGDEAVE